MTLKFRNRLNFSLLILSAAITLSTVMLFVIQLIRGAISFKDFESFVKPESYLLIRYNPIIALSSIFYEQFFAVCSFYIVLRAFTKTQAQNLIFYFVFLIGLLLDSIRIIIPLFNIANTYTSLLITCGNIGVFCNLIIPLSLLGTATIGEYDQKNNIEQFLFPMILLCIFFASIIPLNTSKNLPNFSVDFSFKKTILAFNIISYIMSITIIIISNILKKKNQLTAIGFFLMIIGVILFRGATNYIHFAASIVLSSIGEFIYLKELHNQYLWND